jgi:hypothetical protein
MRLFATIGTNPKQPAVGSTQSSFTLHGEQAKRPEPIQSIEGVVE